MALDRSQTRFIRSKVRKLGSREAVKEHYDQDDLVSEYANNYARKKYGIKRRE